MTFDFYQRKKIRFGKEEPSELAKVQEAGIVRGNLGKFESETGRIKGRNAKGKKGMTGRKDSGRKRKEVHNNLFPHEDNPQGELNTGETQRLTYFKNFKLNLTEGSQNSQNTSKKDAHFPELRLGKEKLRPTSTLFKKWDILKPENTEKDASISNTRV